MVLVIVVCYVRAIYQAAFFAQIRPPALNAKVDTTYQVGCASHVQEQAVRSATLPYLQIVSLATLAITFLAPLVPIVLR